VQVGEAEVAGAFCELAQELGSLGDAQEKVEVIPHHRVGEDFDAGKPLQAPH